MYIFVVNGYLFIIQAYFFLLGFLPWQIMRRESARALQSSTLFDLSQVDSFFLFTYDRNNARDLRLIVSIWKHQTFINKDSNRNNRTNIYSNPMFFFFIFRTTFHCGFNHQPIIWSHHVLQILFCYCHCGCGWSCSSSHSNRNRVSILMHLSVLI